jgi:histidinol-phosphate aminotransferase
MKNPIRKSVDAMQPYVPGEQPTDPEVLKLNTNENPYPPSGAVRAALSDFPIDLLRKYPDPICRELREAIGKIHKCAPEQVFVGNGSDEILLLCIRAFVERDASIGFFEPSYSLYPVLAAIENLQSLATPLGPGFEWVDPPMGGSSLFFITNPNAPTGMLFSKRDVARFCGSYQGVVVIDEAYVDFAKENCLDVAGSFQNVIVTRSLSKSYSLAGLRLGYAIGPPELITALFKIKDSYNVDILAQRVGLAALRDQEYFRDVVERTCATRERVADALRERSYEVSPSEANFLWIRPPHLKADELFRYLRELKVLVRYFPGESTGEYLRVSIGTNEEMDTFLTYLP